ncbi:mitochondrial carrier protein-like protein [Rhizodiscina lignyota]|uniref:Mitochondrial carrier protein-like protein n=1 Tax=Rhizodiscina lignyota TaxID=1504668 RepID=A0A9P4I650_9PEZI|nr:mitochondrial carrier protein-like protein [Rhizodiscina lignyota]
MSHNNTSADIWIAGAVAAFTVDLLVYPLDTLKTRLQSPNYARLYTSPSSTPNAAAVINRAALFRGLYQGVGSVIIATLPSSGAFFTTYEGVKYSLSNANPIVGERSGGKDHGVPLLPQPFIHSAASAVAELVSCAILTPAEVIKQNAQMVDNGHRRNATNATVQTLAKFRANPLGLWRGYAALAGRNLPFTALQFPMFERFKLLIKDYRERSGKRTGTLLESGLITALSAGTAGSVAAVVTTPIDVVKTRIMLAAADGHHGADQKSAPSGKAVLEKVKQGETSGLVDAMGRAAKQAKPRKRKTSWAIGKEIVQEQGFKGLWRGGALRGVWTMIGSGLYLGVYESGRIYLARRRGMDIDEDDLF